MRLRGRRDSELSDNYVKFSLFFGIYYGLRRWFGFKCSDASKIKIWASKKISKQLKEDDLIDTAGIYAYNGAALETFQRGKNYDSLCILEQTIAPKAKEMILINKEKESFPNWITNDSLTDENEIVDREFKEWELADKIICGSEFVKNSIQEIGGPFSKCEVVPYGYDSIVFTTKISNIRPHSPLRILTVGEVGLRKGTPYVYRAALELKSKAIFQMVGPINVPKNIKEKLCKYVKLIGSVSRNQVYEYYNWADVFLLPSICEGSATVVYEAMSFGLPIICTPNTGSIVKDCVEGFIIEPGDHRGIIEKVLRLNTDTDLYKRMSANSLKRYESEGTLNAYSNRLIKSLKSVTD